MPEIFCWVYAGTRDPLFIRGSGGVDIPAHLGMHVDYRESRIPRPGEPLPGQVYDQVTGTWPNEDQTHHFAAYFYWGAKPLFFGNSNIVLKRTLSHTGDFPRTVNRGDYNLGILAADIGNAWLNGGDLSLAIGDLDLLKTDWQTAFAAMGRTTWPQ